MKTPTIRSSGGFTIFEAIVSAGILGLIAIGIMTYFSGRLRSADILERRGQLEDVKTLIRSSLDCGQTVKAIGKACKGKTFADRLYVDLAKADGSAIVASNGQRFGKYWQIRAACQDDGPLLSFKIERRYHPKILQKGDPLIDTAGEWADALDGIPVACAAMRGAWYAAYRQHCPTFCGTLGLTNARSPDDYLRDLGGGKSLRVLGGFCASGETVPRSAQAAFAEGVYTYPDGCWPSCPAACSADDWCREGVSVGDRCYGIVNVTSPEPQKQDSDSTDYTVACYCE